MNTVSVLLEMHLRKEAKNQWFCIISFNKPSLSFITRSLRKLHLDLLKRASGGLSKIVFFFFLLFPGCYFITFKIYNHYFIYWCKQQRCGIDQIMIGEFSCLWWGNMYMGAWSALGPGVLKQLSTTTDRLVKGKTPPLWLASSRSLEY